MKEYQERRLLDSVDNLVERLLDSASITVPPINCLTLSKLLGISVLWDNNLEGRGRQKQISGQPTILVKPDDRPERIQWAIAHEIGEIIIHQIYENDPELFDNSISRSREQLANLVACRLLVPQIWFSRDCIEVEFDLFELKKRYQTASHEVIANRFPDQNPFMVITIFDQGIKTRRSSHSSFPNVPLSPVEYDLWHKSHQKNLPVYKKKSGIEIFCWPIHENEWEREILCTKFTESFFETDFSENQEMIGFP